jgi:anti-sigma factor RsiW
MHRGHLRSETLGAYLDGELSAPVAAAVQAHTAKCAPCASELKMARRLRARLRAEIPFHRAEPALLARILTIACETTPAEPSVRGTILPFNRPPRWIPAVAVAAAAAAAAACILVVSSLALRPNSVMPSHLVKAIVDDHIHSVMASNLTDVRPPETSDVKALFANKLENLPVVQDFSDDGYILASGRLDELEGRTVAALVYRYDGHVIDVFALPDGKQDADPVEDSSRGYALTSWSCEGMTYWAVSDTDPAALRKLALLVTAVADAGEQ